MYSLVLHFIPLVKTFEKSDHLIVVINVAQFAERIPYCGSPSVC